MRIGKLRIVSNLTIKQVWNAEVVDEDRGYFDNMGYNQNINRLPECKFWVELQSVMAMKWKFMIRRFTK